MLVFAADGHISAELPSVTIWFPSAPRISEYYLEKNTLSSTVKPLESITLQFRSMLPKFSQWVFVVRYNQIISKNIYPIQPVTN
jgi:hypothetical protein